MAHPVLADNNFLVPNATFIVELIAFLVIFAFMGRFILPRIQRPLRARQQLIRAQVDDAEAARSRLVEAERVYQQALTEARLEAAQIRENARAEAQRTIDELRQRAQEESARIVARGDEQLAAQRSSILQELRASIGTMAVELSEKIVDQPLAQDHDVSTTVDSFLAGLAATDQARNGADA